MKILLCNSKGGTGKTSLSVLLSHALAEAGRDVSIIDLDPQGTASKWLEELEESPVEIHNPEREYDAVFIDTAPRLDLLPDALKIADVVLIVSSPSPADLWTSRDTARVIQEHHPDARIRILFNNVQANTLLAKTADDLATRIGVPAMKTMIARRQCYQHAALLGWKALNSNAREEIFKAAIEIVSK